MADTRDSLLETFDRLDAQGRQSLLDFAAFLAERHALPPTEQGLPEPALLPRPDNESVVKAIKRLSASYSMLDRSSIFHPSSALMTEHIMHGRPAAEVIDDLERLFEREYQKLRDNDVKP